MKKLTALFLMLSVCMVVVGCSGDTGGTKTDAKKPPASSSDTKKAP